MPQRKLPRLNRSVALPMCIALSAAAPPTETAVPICGDGDLKLVDGGIATFNMYQREATEVALRFPLSASKRGRFLFDREPELRIEYDWPGEEFSPRPMFFWGEMTDNGRPAEGVLQFECGRRNMGLVNFEVNFGLPQGDHETDGDAVDCIRELDADGAYRVAMDQDAVVHVLMSDRIRLNAARLQVRQFIDRELERERAGLCQIRQIPVVF
jgi:hypothetical protein